VKNAKLANVLKWVNLVGSVANFACALNAASNHRIGSAIIGLFFGGFCFHAAMKMSELVEKLKKEKEGK